MRDTEQLRLRQVYGMRTTKTSDDPMKYIFTCQLCDWFLETGEGIDEGVNGQVQFIAHLLSHSDHELLAYMAYIEIMRSHSPVTIL